jgi:hypothetical protein
LDLLLRTLALGGRRTDEKIVYYDLIHNQLSREERLRGLQTLQIDARAS